MTTPLQDPRSQVRKDHDERIAAEPPLAAPPLPPGTRPTPMESHLGQLRQPIAVAGIVENGLVRPLDPAVKLPEHSRVIIVTTR
jgi:hypothetical protein